MHVRHAVRMLAATLALLMPLSAHGQGSARDGSGGIPLRILPAAAGDYATTRGPVRNADVAFIGSLVVPGAGQYVLKQDRWLPYAAVEAWAWLRYLDRRSTARKLSRQYKDFAWNVARRISTGERRDTTFPYYEVLIHFGASGAFDAQPNTPGTQPEFDLTTYNGDRWDIARRIFIPTGSSGEPGAPGYDAALAYYESTAIPDRFAFAWNTGRLEQKVYENVINESDGAYRDATRLLGLILANHLTSAVDALISARLRSAGSSLRIDSGLAPDPLPGTDAAPLRLDLRFRFTW